jgi:hypothetical protein
LERAQAGDHRARWPVRDRDRRSGLHRWLPHRRRAAPDRGRLSWGGEDRRAGQSCGERGASDTRRNIAGWNANAGRGGHCYGHTPANEDAFTHSLCHHHCYSYTHGYGDRDCDRNAPAHTPGDGDGDGNGDSSAFANRSTGCGGNGADPFP